MRNIFPAIYFLLLAPVLTHAASAPDKLVGIHSARVMSQSLPWMAEEAGLFKKYNIDFNLVFISSSSIVTAALLGGDAEMTLTGGIGNVIAYVRGSTRYGFRRRGKKRHDSESGRGRSSQKTRGSQREKDRGQPHRRQHSLFHDPGSAPSRPRTQSGF